MKKVVLVVLAVMFVLVGLYLTREEYNPYFDEEYDALMESKEWHHEYASSQGNEVFWRNDGSEYFVVEVFGDHHDEFLDLDI